ADTHTHSLLTPTYACTYSGTHTDTLTHTPHLFLTVGSHTHRHTHTHTTSPLPKCSFRHTHTHTHTHLFLSVASHTLTTPITSFTVRQKSCIRADTSRNARHTQHTTTQQ